MGERDRVQALIEDIDYVSASLSFWVESAGGAEQTDRLRDDLISLEGSLLRVRDVIEQEGQREKEG